jgi:hypothetical protein
MILLDTHKLHWCGTNGTISYQSVIRPLALEVKSHFLSQAGIDLVRVCSSSSRTLSLLWGTFANHKGMHEGHPKVMKSLLNTLTTKWAERSPLSVDPPYIDTIASNFGELH